MNIKLIKTKSSAALIALLAGYSSLSISAQSIVKLDFEPTVTQSESVTINTQFATPDFVPGVKGQAWRTDGFSSWASIEADSSNQTDLTVSTWIAIESFPSDHETHVKNLQPSSIVNQKANDAGFDIFIDTYGRWGLWLGTTKEPIKLQAKGLFPKYKWVKVTAVINSGKGIAELFLNQQLVAQQALPDGAKFKPASSKLMLARSTEERSILNFTINRLNAAYDEFELTSSALSYEQVAKSYAEHAAHGTNPMVSLDVPESRFANDHLRPRLHGMPPANWTNEPHGLVRKNGRWHMFYQRTPNGPFKTQMHWGHMYSDDLVNWTNTQDALWPELQTDVFGFDQKGIWSGDVIIEGDTAFAFYTSVNHFDRLKSANPGVAMAVSKDPNLLHWEKKGPLINTKHVKDFRDPYLWKEDNSWHMIIGAAYENYGGLDYYVLDFNKADEGWKHKRQFSTLSYRRMDIGSIIWEMPVFEPLTDAVHVLVVNPIGGAVEKYGDPATRGVYWTGTWEDGVFEPHYKEPKLLDIIVGHLSPTVARGDDGALRGIGIVDERRTPQAQEDAGWTHTFSLPRSWFLMPDGQTLGQAPAPELKKLRTEQLVKQSDIFIGSKASTLISGEVSYELEIDGLALGEQTLLIDMFADANNAEVTQLRIDADSNIITLDKSKSSLSGEDEGPQVLTGKYDAEAFGEINTVRVFADGSVVDVFINDAAAFSIRTYPSKASSSELRISSGSNELKAAQVNVWKLEGSLSANSNNCCNK